MTIFSFGDLTFFKYELTLKKSFFTANFMLWNF